MSDWIGLAVIAFLVLCGLFGLSRLGKPYDVSAEEFERRAQEGATASFSSNGGTEPRGRHGASASSTDVARPRSLQ
jgi:hypothetical protein